MEAYINGIGNISPQNTIANTEFLEKIVENEINILKCIEPDYKNYISPALSRRMSRIIKLGISSSQICLNDAEIKIPDAIITGTGMGCIEDTEKFLTALINNNEEFLTPTSFIQSTHNTVSSQIALQIGCHNYNYTYVHRGFSFESALLDAMMHINENSANNILVGAIDELTDDYLKISTRTGFWKKENINNLKLLENKTNGSIAGEGSSFFLLSNQPTIKSYAKIKYISTFFNPESKIEALNKICDFLTQNNLNLSEIDLVLQGFNGDLQYDSIYYYLAENIFNNNNIAYFKHLCGEYHTASAFGLWLAAKVISNQFVPEIVKFNSFKTNKIENILIYNHWRNTDHSLILISKC